MGKKSTTPKLITPPSRPEHEIEDEVANGRGTVAEDTAQELGGLNAEAVQSNQRRKAVLDKKRAGQREVPWGEQNACLLYDDILQLWPANTLAIMVTRLTGSPATWYLYGTPRNGPELYQAILNQCHGRSQETQYQVDIRDGQRKFDRGRARIVMPNTVDDPRPIGEPMQGQAPQRPQSPYATSPAAPYAAAPMNGATPAGASPHDAVMYEVARQLGALATMIQGQRSAPGGAPAAPAVGVGAPVVASPPSIQPPPGWVIVVAANGTQTMVPAGQVGLTGTAAPAPAPAAAAVVRSPAEEFRSTVATLKSVVEAVSGLQDIVPQPAAAAPTTPEPTKLVQLGDIKAVQNTDDGSIRLVDTVLANGDKIMGWIKEQQDQFRRAQERAQNPNGAQQQAAPQGGMMAPPTIGSAT